MKLKDKKFVLSSFLLATMSALFGSAVYAAEPLDLSHQSGSILQTFQLNLASKFIGLEEISRAVDHQGTLHVRVQETYQGYPVLGADAVIHIPQGSHTPKNIASVVSSVKESGSMDGTLYQNINVDLINTPQYVFTSSQAQKALDAAITNYQDSLGLKVTVDNKETNLIVYLDKNSKAHWAYKVMFYVTSTKQGSFPAKPVFIIDAVSMKILEKWNDIKTLERPAFGGGFGGNITSGRLVYDGLKDHLPKLNIVRDTKNKICYLKNFDVTVEHYSDGRVPSFLCEQVNTEHNNVYWDDAFHAVNDNYSPDNDALFSGNVIKDLYQNWYGVPVLTDKNGQPKMLTMVVHSPIDNIYWDGNRVVVGDANFSPTITFLAHEVSHGFTEQHSNLFYSGQSGAINEAFSDMAGQAAEFLAYGKNNWQLGNIRYMDKPSKDCEGRKPGDWCSIDDASQYYYALDVHFSCGVYNRFFYNLATSKDWTVKKAFEVMLNANLYYWTSSTDFVKGACGVIKAAKDLGYSTDDIVRAANIVKIDTGSCSC